MQFSNIMLRALIPCLLVQVVLPQDLPFEIPVQLIGFPVIILAVRLSNFLKKLSYAVNPNTYKSRAKRDSELAPLDIAEIEKKLIQEMGEKVCVYEDVCKEYADKVNSDRNFVLDWQDIFRQYEKSPRGKKEFYLLSVFMGDIVKSRDLCSQLAKRGRSCSTNNQSINEQVNNGTIISHNKQFAHENQSNTYLQVHKSHEITSYQQPLQNTPEKTKVSHHISPHHLSQSNHQVYGTHHQNGQVHHQVHRHHVEIHYEPEQIRQGLLFGQHPPHNIHYTSRRKISS